MKPITTLMVKDLKIMKLGYDQMGYKVDRKSSLSFHHMIISHQECKLRHLPCEGYVYENGAILVQETSHDYLHLVQKLDEDVFYAITSELIDENIKRRIDIENLRQINDCLEYFERHYCNERNKKGKRLIKQEYYNRLQF